MPDNELSPAISSIAGPLKEAADYEELQWARRRGAWGGIMALTFLAFSIRRFLASEGWPLVVATSLFLVMAILLLWANNRPAWRAVFRDPAESDRPPWRRIALVFLPLLILYAVASELGRDASGSVATASAAVQILVMSGGMAFAVRQTKDRAMLAALAICGVVAVPVVLGWIPSQWAMATWFLCVGASWLMVALVRLAAPRRWLVR